MRMLPAIVCLLLLSSTTAAQVVEETPSPTAEQQLENITENNEDLETEDDSYLQQLIQFSKNPLNLNAADAGDLRQLRILSPIQIGNLLSYRSLLGNFINLYELQAIPGWDIGTINKIRPYVNVSEPVSVRAAMQSRFAGGEHSLLFRVSQIIERSKGYLVDPATVNNFYPGSPQKLFMRYRYVYKNLLQYGIVGEKDAGEQFFRGSQKQGFDFYSAHLFARKIGIIRSLAIGDFTVNLGQGLTQWQSLAFRKSVEITNIKREAEVLRPYNSAGEINFQRGAGITLEKNNWTATLFASYKKIDANFVADTSQTQDDFVSSLQTSGFHRTKSEVEDKGIQRQIAFGGNLSYQYKSLHLGINGVHYNFKLPLKKSDDPYNKFALSGNSFGNYSVDYSYTYRNMHLFGEAAVTNGFDKAFIQGLLISASVLVDLSFVYRNISRSYQSLYTTAFTENTFPTNEKGFYAGMSIRPHTAWRIDAYADFYKFPWLRFRVDAPSTGADYLLQLTYRPGRQLEVYSRFRAESKALNANPDQLTLSSVVQQPRKNWRTQVSYALNSDIVLRNRTELSWFDRNGPAASEGFLSYFDFIFKPQLKRYAGSIRLQYFETDDYNSRLYAYENDVLYSFSIPVFYEKGFRYYINMNYDLTRKLRVWIKWGQTMFPDRTSVGSGLDEISGNRRSEIKVQAMYKF